MSVTTQLLRVIEVAHSPTGVLEGAVRVVARQLGAEAVWAFLLDADASPFHAASFRESGVGIAAEEQQARLLTTDSLDQRRTFIRSHDAEQWLVSPMILRDRKVGALVVLVRSRSYSADDVAELTTMAALLVTIVENARVVGALAHRDGAPAPEAPVEGRPAGEQVLSGVAASPGVAMGPAMFRGGYRLERAADRALTGAPPHERKRAHEALMMAHSDLSRIQREAAREIDEEHALIFAAHLLLLNDPTLLAYIDAQITSGASAPTAIAVAFDELERRLRLAPDPYVREKIEDVDDLRGRLLGNLAGNARPRLATQVVISVAIAPSLVVEMKSQGAQGLVTETGGVTSHGVLLARAMGIPVVTGIPGLLGKVRPHDALIVDGTSGVVVVNPSEETSRRYAAAREQLRQTRAEYARYRTVLATTADGTRVPIRANVGLASELAVAREYGAEGVGLYRTEFPFIIRDAFPTREEQARIYAKAYEVFPEGPIQFRLLDLGGDKFVTSGQMSGSRSAFHGYRSIRVLFDHPDVLRNQVQAFALAAQGRPLRILIPMVSSMDELRRVRDMIEQALAEGPPSVVEVGAMIEVPAAVELAREIASEVDFLSIGTNDLMQYTLVVDREDSRMAPAYDPYHPAILRMIARVAAAAREVGKPVAVCGEIAVRPDLALALVALGVDSLSVAPMAIPQLKQALAKRRLSSIARELAGILLLGDAASVASALNAADGPT